MNETHFPDSDTASSAIGPRPIVWLSAVSWDFPLVGRTRMLTEAWRRTGREVTFVQIPSFRSAARELGSTFRADRRATGTARKAIRDFARTGFGRRPEPTPDEAGDTDDFVVCPWPAAPAMTWSHISESRIRRTIRSRASGLRRRLEARANLAEAVALVVSPAWAPWLESLPFHSIVYDCIDDLSVMTPRPALRHLYERWETELIHRADAAVVSTRQLAPRIRVRRPELPIATIRNGAPVEAFRKRAANASLPPDFPKRKGRPCVGFVGALYEWIDWALIRTVAERAPELEFVFVGPVRARSASARFTVRSLESLPNVHFLGARAYPEVPAYVAHFDVAWLPFRNDEVSAVSNPVKIYEYLCLEKPVVSTPVGDLASFRGLVSVGRSPEEIVRLLRRAICSPASMREERRRFASRNDWQIRADSYLGFVDAIAGTGRERSPSLASRRINTNPAARRGPTSPNRVEI